VCAYCCYDGDLASIYFECYCDKIYCKKITRHCIQGGDMMNDDEDGGDYDDDDGECRGDECCENCIIETRRFDMCDCKICKEIEDEQIFPK
jgi:hypothetical protein